MRQLRGPLPAARNASSLSVIGAMMSSGPQSWLSASSMLVPAVFLVLRKMNWCSCEMIMKR